MDKFKGLAKGGWHPAGDKSISRDTWKSDLKGMTVNRNKDPYEEQRNHQSAPLTTLKDPSSFGPPPKHRGWYGADGAPTSPAGSSAGEGLGSAVPRTPVRRPTQEQQEQQQAIEAPPQSSRPNRTNTASLSTANLPKPPVRRTGGAAAAPDPSSRSAASPPVPARQPQARPQPAQSNEPPPTLPPRMSEYPDEYTPPPPPTYQEATVQPEAQQQAQNPATINGVAVGRLAQAGVNVPGFGIGGSNGSASQGIQPQSPSTQGHPSQLSELQQRFSRMGTGTSGQATPPPQAQASNPAAAAAQKKAAPPPPPPKKAALGGNRPGSADGGGEGGAGAPPPLPLSSKPRPS